MKDMGKKEYDILCIGSCVQDILIEGMRPEDFKQSVTVLEEAVFTSGGDAANEAVVLSRLGSKAALLTKLDTSTVGTMLLEDLKQEGVDTTHIVRDKDSRCTTAFVILNEKGEHVFFLAKGEREGIAAEDIPFDILKQTKAICIGSLYTTYKLNDGGAFQIMKAAKEAGAITFADLDHDVEQKGPKAMDGLMPYVDYLLPSMEEARYITGVQGEKEAALLLLSRGVKTVIIKLGDKGCYVKSKEEAFYVDPFVVEPKDTTGCGDNFVAGFIHSVLSGKCLMESATFACAAGAINSLKMGGHRAVKSNRQVEQFLCTTDQRKVER